MSEHQAARPVDLSLSSASKKPDSQLRLVGADGKVLFPENGKPTDQAATIISRNKARASPTSVTAGEVLAGKSLRGQRLAHFELQEPLGVGGMAAVILARDTQLDRLVALKILPPEMASDVENIRRFHQEARAAAKLNHENIARVFFFGEDKELHFIAFEYVEGDNLRTLLERRGKLPVAEAVRYVLQIAAGLEHAAGRGVVHRDIKPSNIIINPNGQAKLVDMGLARNAETHSDQALTQSGVTLGTFDYISPEQALEPREADVRSDIYSLGCTFYHMLTGQAPVPEGTAAKKLYHHQHLAPIDPRQFNPDIPDEIAAILMRMMAKNPKDRYQKPINLIQHLMQVAQKIGVTSDMPEGVMFLDTPLPGAPRYRPLLTIALAALALGVLLMLVSMGPSPKGTTLPPPPNPGSVHTSDIKTKDVKDAPVTPPVSPRLNVPDTVLTREELYAAVTDSTRNSKLVTVEKDADFTEGRQVWKLDKDRTKSLVASAKKMVTLKFEYKKGDQDNPDDMVAGLVLEGDAPVTFENMRFELSAKESFANAVAMIAVRGTGSVRFRRCIFASNVPPIDKARKDLPFSVVLLGNSTDRDSTGKGFQVTFDECLWEQGAQAAVNVQGPGKITAQNCGFEPHAALFRLSGNSLESELTMLRCSSFLTLGPAFRLDDSHSCKFKIQQSIFSCPDSPGDDVQLIRQTGLGNLVAEYDGTRNVYHNLKGLWSSPPDFDSKLDLEDFRSRLATGTTYASKDVDSVILASSPWADAHPLKKLFMQPKEAFQVTSKRSDVRTVDGRALGIVSCVWGPMSQLAPLPSDVKTPLAVQTNTNEKIVDPDDTAELTPGVYNSLSKALLSAKSGDVVLIKHGEHSREVTLNVLNLPEPKNLTIKPYSSKFHPVLVLSTQEKGAAMFRLFDGKLQFENLEFVLEPDSQDVKGQTVVAMSSNGMCSFKNCVITLNQGLQRRLPLSAVSLLDLDDVMKMPTSPAAPPVRSQPIVSFTDSLIRGEGDLVCVKSSRPFELKIDNTLAALAGSLLVVQGANKDLSGEMVMPGIVKMSRVTAFLTEPAIVLRAGKTAPGLVPTRCESVRESLFVALADKPFLSLEGIEIGEDVPRQYLDWKGGENKNAYVNMPRMLEIARPDDTMSLGNLDADGWKSKIETDAHFFEKGVRFNIPPLQLRSFSQMTFDHFRPTQSWQAKLAGFGANLNPEVLPRFTVPRKIEAP